METLLSSISLLLVGAVFASRVRSDYWLFKVLEYPRLQKLGIIIAILLIWIVVLPVDTIFDWASFGALCIAAFYLCYKIFPYTTMARRETKSVKDFSEDCKITMFTANVLQTNREYTHMLEQIKSMDPDFIMLLETDREWAEAVKGLKESHPHTLLEPRDNTYGLLCYSRYPLHNAAVRHLVKEDIPSIRADVQLPCGQAVRIFGLHPEPPVPGENLYSTAKDKELMKVALEIRDGDLPCIVLGDLNDVAWSHTTELFRKTSGLLDPRRGRGFFSTFSAHSSWLRFPLDYIFCSSKFGLASMQRMPPNGSDHFAICTSLIWHPPLEAVQEAPRADAEEVGEAKEKATQAVPENG